MQTTMTCLAENQRVQIGTLKALGFHNKQIKFHFACSKSLKRMPAEILRGAVPKTGKRILVERIPFIWKRLSFGWKWSLKDISRNKVKTIMRIIGVFECMMLLIASLGMKNSLDYANNYVYNTQYTYGTKAVLQQNTTEENRDELIKIAGESQWVQEIPLEIKVNDKEKSAFISIVDSGNFVNLETLENKIIEFPQEGVFITRKIAEQLDLNVGDEFEFRARGYENFTTSIITEIVSAPSPQGIFISSNQWEQMGKSFVPTLLLIKSNSIEEKIKDLSYVQESTTIDNQLQSTRNITESISIIFFLLKIAAVVLGVVILYNLGVLSYTERTREYAALKVAGFYQKEIRFFALRENIFITVIGWLIGIPIGISFLKIYVRTVSMDSFDWVAKLTPLSFIIASVITVGCSIGVSLLLTQKVKKINMVEALKTVE